MPRGRKVELVCDACVKLVGTRDDVEQQGQIGGGARHRADDCEVMDLVGAYALACVNAFGGGTVRDLLLDNRPFYWAAHWGYLVAILALCVPFVYSAKFLRVAEAVHKRADKVDAVGLALFTIAGTGIALEKDAPLIVAMLMTRSTPARLYQLRSKITISPAAGRCRM